MTQPSVLVRSAIAGVGLAIAALTPGALAQHAPMCASCAACRDQNIAPEADAAARVLIEATTFWALPESHRDVIAGRLMEMGEPVPSLTPRSARPNDALDGRDASLSQKEIEHAWAVVGPWDVCTREQFERFNPVHQRMVMRMCEQLAEGHVFQVQPCFAVGTDPALVNAVSDITSFGRVNNQNPRFEQIGRWGGTALDPSSSGTQGEPTILTYSFPADGTFVSSGVGEGPGVNDLNAFMDGIYGNRATWRAIYDDIFDRWEELSGVTYVLEPNDDGADLIFDENNPSGNDPNPGVSGVRGDMRMVGKAIDGNSGTLAYNFFPQVGDMVIDTADNFYENLTNSSIRLRNILWHEHGHGMGQLHVCPIQENKLMEPFISTAFEGPQFDDILNAQRHYGDNLEPNDNAGEATDLGAFPVPSNANVELVSLDDDNDQDFYRFSIASASEVEITVTPLTANYQAGPQTFFCDENNPYNPLVFLNPGLELISGDGTTIIETASANPAGQNETIVRTLNPGDYLVRLNGTQPNGDQIIAYRLDIDAREPAFIPLTIGIPGGLPTELEPGVAVDVVITIDEGEDTLVGSPAINFRRAGEGSFTSLPTSLTGPNEYTASLPAFFCEENPELFVSADAAVQGVITFPEMGTTQAGVSSGVQVTLDNVETDIGWTVSGNAVEGIWERGVPQNNGRDDPPADFDGSGQCWLTGQFVGDPNSDVDGGSTVLTSPEFDYSGGGTISYAYWAQDTVNPIGPGDGLFVEYTVDDGDNWVRIRTYGTAGAWRQDTVDVDSEIGTPSALRIRFIAADVDPGDVLECGIDALDFTRTFCEDPAGSLCTADFNNDNTVDIIDFGVFGSAFGSSAGDPNYNAVADFNNDDTVDIIDFGVFGTQFGNGPAECMP